MMKKMPTMATAMRHLPELPATDSLCEFCHRLALDSGN
jgi:hypothetical protein